ncbi:hypothetical protein WJX77_012625 [Trebouxia sp. C0004]
MMRQMRFMSKISLVLETLSIAQWTFLHTWLLSKTPLSSCLGSSRFMRKITAKCAPAILHSRPYEKECPKVFDLQKPKYKPRTGF